MKEVLVLMVDDNPVVVELTKFAHRCFDYIDNYKLKFIYAYDGVQGLEEAREMRPDIILVDLVMPRMDGFQLIRCLRDDPRTAHIPLIVLSFLASEEDQIRGFLSGCDAYMTKPFKPSLLWLQIEASIRRQEREQQIQQGKLLCVADIQMNILAHTVSRAEHELKLTETEYRLLECFLRHPGEALQRSFLQDEVWGRDADVESNIVDVYVGYLRKKLEEGGADRLIQTKRGIGYLLAVPSNTKQC